MANGQNIDYSEKENGPRASSAPALGLNTIIFKYVYWYMKQISGERLQDHWSSGQSLEYLVIEIYTFLLVYPLYFSEIFYLIFKVLITISSMRKSNYLYFIT